MRRAILAVLPAILLPVLASCTASTTASGRYDTTAASRDDSELTTPLPAWAIPTATLLAQPTTVIHERPATGRRIGHTVSLGVTYGNGPAGSGGPSGDSSTGGTPGGPLRMPLTYLPGQVNTLSGRVGPPGNSPAATGVTVAH